MLLTRRQFNCKGGNDLLGDLVLQRKDIAELSVIAVRPEVSARFGVYELGVNPHLVVGPSNASFQHVANPKLTAYLIDLDGLTFVREGGVSGNNKQPRDFREIGDQVFRHAIRKVFLFRIFADVGEREHGNGGLLRQRKCHPLHIGNFLHERGRTQVKVPDHHSHHTEHEYSCYGQSRFAPLPLCGISRLDNSFCGGPWKG